jgi:hypothetical protein
VVAITIGSNGYLVPMNPRSWGDFKAVIAVEALASWPLQGPGEPSATIQPPVTEPDAMVIETEDKVSKAYQGNAAKATLSELSAQLRSVWESFGGKGNGLFCERSGISKASIVGSLLLLLHHPPLLRAQPEPSPSSGVRFSSRVNSRKGYTPIPKALLN